jgi:hypothetical protein
VAPCRTTCPSSAAQQARYTKLGSVRFFFVVRPLDDQSSLADEGSRSSEVCQAAVAWRSVRQPKSFTSSVVGAGPGLLSQITIDSRRRRCGTPAVHNCHTTHLYAHHKMRLVR